MNQEPTIRLSLPISVVEHLLRSLDEQPRRISNPIFTLIQGQAAAQLQAQAEPKTGMGNEHVVSVEEKKD